MSGKLLPCPFCGGEAEVIHLDDGENAGGSCVSCTKCLSSSSVEFEFKENFVSNWNRRFLLPIECSTCGGTGEIDETIGGLSTSDQHAQCPDCSKVTEPAELTRFRSENAELAHPELLGWRCETIKRDGRFGLAITFGSLEDRYRFENWLMQNVETSRGLSRVSGGGK